MASSASAVVISGVVFSLFTEPPAANAIAIAAALTLSGISVMTTTSYSPKAKNALWMRPPSFSIGPHRFDAFLGIGNEARPSFRRVAHLTEIMRHGILLRNCEVSGEAGGAAQGK